MNDTPTPETDYAYIQCPNEGAWDFRIRQEKTMAKLERERDDAREVLREIRDNEVNPEDEADKFLRDHVPSGLSKVREQRDRLAEALRKIANEDYRGNAPQSVFIARAALAILSQPKP